VQPLQHHSHPRGHAPGVSCDARPDWQSPKHSRRFPDTLAPVVRTARDGERELTMMRWGFPRPPNLGNAPVTNVRNLKSPYWRGWLKAEWRCLVPAASFCEIRCRCFWLAGRYRNSDIAQASQVLQVRRPSYRRATGLDAIPGRWEWAIADDGRLSNPAHAQLLPPHWGTLTKLSDEEFEAPIRNTAKKPAADPWR
jgi:hypothetical protein